MPQMAIIQPTAPTAPQAPLAGPSGSKEQGHFSPLLENALSSNKKQQQARHDKDNSDTSTASDKNILTDENSQSMEPQGLEDSHEPIASANTDKTDFIAVANTEAPANTDAPADALKENPEQTLFAPLDTETAQPIRGSAFSQIRQVESSINLPQNTSVAIGTELNKATKAPGSYAILSELGFYRSAALLITGEEEAVGKQFYYSHVQTFSLPTFIGKLNADESSANNNQLFGFINSL